MGDEAKCGNLVSFEGEERHSRQVPGNFLTVVRLRRRDAEVAALLHLLQSLVEAPNANTSGLWPTDDINEDY